MVSLEKTQHRLQQLCWSEAGGIVISCPSSSEAGVGEAGSAVFSGQGCTDHVPRGPAHKRATTKADLTPCSQPGAAEEDLETRQSRGRSVHLRATVAKTQREAG